VRVDAGGANDGVGRFERNVLGVFEKAFENAAEFPASPSKEAGAMCVPVNRVPVPPSSKIKSKFKGAGETPALRNSRSAVKCCSSCTGICL